MRAGYSRAAALFPWFVGTCLALVANHRFGIELNTFHTLALGIVIWGLSGWFRADGQMPSLWDRGWLVLGVVLGVSSHALFLGTALGLWTTFLLLVPLEKRAREEFYLPVAAAALLLPMSVKVLLVYQETFKAVGFLIILLGIILGSGFFLRCRPQILESVRKLSFRWGGFAAVPAFFMGSWFLEGHWGVLFSRGVILRTEWIGIWIIAVLGLLFSLRRLIRGHRLMLGLWFWAAHSAVFLAALMVKPASRYYETFFMLVILLLAVSVSRVGRWRFASSLICAFGFAGIVQNYGGIQNLSRPWDPSGGVIESVYGNFWLRDRNSDALPKQVLAKDLGQMGCSLSDLRSEDPRLMEALRFLARGDWPIASQQSCGGPWEVRRWGLSQEGLPASGWRRLGLFGIKKVVIPKEGSQ